MKRVFTILAMITSIVVHSQITKVEIDKPLKEIYIKTLDTFVDLYSDEVKVSTYDAKYPTIKPRFTFSVSLENYEAMYELTTNTDVEVGDTFTLYTTDSKTIIIMFDKIWGSKKPFPFMYVDGKQVPPNVLYGRYKKKFFNKY